jgi:hypothetical protein
MSDDRAPKGWDLSGAGKYQLPHKQWNFFHMIGWKALDILHGKPKPHPTNFCFAFQTLLFSVPKRHPSCRNIVATTPPTQHGFADDIFAEDIFYRDMHDFLALASQLPSLGHEPAPTHSRQPVHPR